MAEINADSAVELTTQLKTVADGSIKIITVALESKTGRKEALRLCKSKLTADGKVVVSGLKNKNALILAGFSDVTFSEDKVATGGIPKETKAVVLNTETASASINPESLLKEEDKQKPNTDYDCGVALGKKRQACKGCTCGLAEELEDEAKTKIKENLDKGASKPSCGSCYLGDAFRCASCPYAGKPAFDPTAPPKLVSSHDFATADN